MFACRNRDSAGREFFSGDICVGAGQFIHVMMFETDPDKNPKGPVFRILAPKVVLND